MDKPLRDAVRKIGGIRATARALGIHHQNVMRWKKTPPMRVLEIERLSGIPRHRLRPDIYPPEEGRKRA